MAVSNLVWYKLVWDPRVRDVTNTEIRMLGDSDQVPKALRQLLEGLHATGHADAAVYREQDWVAV